MKTTNNITNTQQLSDFLKSKGVHHYLDTVTKPIVEKFEYKGLYDWSPMIQSEMIVGEEKREVVEIPIAMLAEKDGNKFFNALNICLELIERGIEVVKSKFNNFLYLTPKHNIVAENN